MTVNQVLDQYDRGEISRRALLAALAGLIGAQATSAQDGPTFAATELNHVALAVTDIERSRAFYERHLGLRTTSAGPASAFLNCGRHFLALFRSSTPGLSHYCYSVPDYSAASAVTRLEGAGLSPRRRGNRVYFDDPDGIEVQVSASNLTA